MVHPLWLVKVDNGSDFINTTSHRVYQTGEEEKRKDRERPRTSEHQATSTRIRTFWNQKFCYTHSCEQSPYNHSGERFKWADSLVFACAEAKADSFKKKKRRPQQCPGSRRRGLNLFHIPLPSANINTYFSLVAKCWLRGGVGGQFPRNE